MLLAMTWMLLQTKGCLMVERCAEDNRTMLLRVVSWRIDQCSNQITWPMDGHASDNGKRGQGIMTRRGNKGQCANRCQTGDGHQLVSHGNLIVDARVSTLTPTNFGLLQPHQHCIGPNGTGLSLPRANGAQLTPLGTIWDSKDARR